MINKKKEFYMLIKDKLLLENLTRKYGKDFVINEMARGRKSKIITIKNEFLAPKNELIFVNHKTNLNSSTTSSP